MKIWNNIVQSETEPSVKSIWFKNNRLWFYNNGIWNPLTDEIGKAPDLSGYLKRQEFTSFTEDLLTRSGRLNQKHFPSVSMQIVTWQNTLSNPIGYSEYNNSMTFMVSVFHDRPLDNRSKNSYSLVTEGGLARAVEQTTLLDPNGKVQSNFMPDLNFSENQSHEGIGTNTSAIRQQSPLTFSYFSYIGNRDPYSGNNNLVAERGLAYVFNKLNVLDSTSGLISTSKLPIKAGYGILVNKTKKDITIEVNHDSNVAYIVYLNIGDSAEIKAHNQAQLPTDGSSFLTCIDQGVGTGRFIQGNGGSATITTADGIRVHYKINVDYSVVKDSTHFDHSELFYYRGEIGLNDISGTTTTPVNYEITDPLVRDSLLRASNFCFDLVVGENKFRVACPCVSIGLTEKVWRSPDIKVGNTNWNCVEFTLSKLENGSYQLSMKAI